MRFGKNSHGFGLIQVLVTLGLFGILSVGISRMTNNTFSLIKKASIDDERNGLFSLVRKSISCEKTYEKMGQPYGSCGAFHDKTIDVYRSDKELIDRLGTKMGNWTVRAHCRNGEGLDVRVAYTGSSSQPLVDPVTKVTLDYDFPKNKLSPALCSDAGESSDPDLDCVTASRSQSNLTATKPNVVEAYNSGTPGTESHKWGLLCRDRYNRMSCTMSTPTKNPSDYDITMINRGCSSDNDEWAGAFTLQIVCCQLSKKT